MIWVICEEVFQAPLFINVALINLGLSVHRWLFACVFIHFFFSKISGKPLHAHEFEAAINKASINRIYSRFALEKKKCLQILGQQTHTVRGSTAFLGSPRKTKQNSEKPKIKNKEKRLREKYHGDSFQTFSSYVFRSSI